ncbi:hypothetical protein M405DRAFT_827047 [Rhizopogon salebrosus TDB-379]|nr:hypothetical protein M405DRAFT_827047 [Rhizopogon salebrosus TDB-379]
MGPWHSCSSYLVRTSIQIANPLTTQPDNKPPVQAPAPSLVRRCEAVNKYSEATHRHSGPGSMPHNPLPQLGA